MIVYGADVRLAQRTARDNEISVLNKRLKSLKLAGRQDDGLAVAGHLHFVEVHDNAVKTDRVYPFEPVGATECHANPRQKFSGTKGLVRGGTEDNDRD